MKPLGRKYYVDKDGGKHYTKVDGKYVAWWLNIIQPSKSRHKTNEKKLIKKEITESGY